VELEGVSLGGVLAAGLLRLAARLLGGLFATWLLISCHACRHAGGYGKENDR